jgi:putative SOS response-associated peptidase YedK
MCGRYVLTSDARKLAEVFGVEVMAHLEPRYNIAPSQPIPAVRIDRDSGRRTLDLLRWGLVPRWADDPSIGNRMINARAESAATKPAYRAAMKYRRCLIPADAFYEWKKLSTGRKQPHLIKHADDEPFAFAGLWEHWQDANGNELESATILTTDANELLAPLHDRMPVILPAEQYDAWLDPANQDSQTMAKWLKPYPAELMIDYPVSNRVNSPKYDDAQCLAPADGPTGGEQTSLF